MSGHPVPCRVVRLLFDGGATRERDQGERNQEMSAELNLRATNDKDRSLPITAGGIAGAGSVTEERERARDADIYRPIAACVRRASLLGVDPGTLERWERGEWVPAGNYHVMVEAWLNAMRDEPVRSDRSVPAERSLAVRSESNFV